MSRNQDRLKEDAKRVTDAAPDTNVDVVTVDLSSTDSVRDSLAEVDKKLAGTPVEFVLYNAARVGPSKLFEWKPEDLEKDLRVRSPTFVHHRPCIQVDKSSRSRPSVSTQSPPTSCHLW